ncbi:Uncharacterized protein OBRU01_08276 [Operophtera brumata]|uniref:Fatty acyl-CoA reductase n=1 Tax=Operophtera brumata TaxID=104452 RepID=A0A0L7LK09_OPEBR|nr:Uncharacterized protein OBRU01_08276 [Operophtera brumata]
MAPSISVAEYYANKSIFITGATGFMGKVLVEKLLRTCPGIKRIYVLMRSKKGHNSKERLEDYFNNKVSVIRTMHCNEDYLADVIPVDMAVNGCILLAYTTALDK